MADRPKPGNLLDTLEWKQTLLAQQRAALDLRDHPAWKALAETLAETRRMFLESMVDTELGLDELRERQGTIRALTIFLTGIRPSESRFRELESDVRLLRDEIARRQDAGVLNQGTA